MNKLEVPFLPLLDKNSSIEEVSAELDSLEKNIIDNIPWPVYSYKPSVKFALGYSNECLFIKFYVAEEAIRAKFRNINDPVYKDSCVEFFISFNEEEKYYNLEFNCLGTCRLGFGEGRENRTLVPEALIRKIRHSVSLQKTALPNGNQVTSWELTLIIPAEVFPYHEILSFKGIRARGNFYKCGDELPRPHYLTWNNINAAEPNFHLPEYFGEVQFV
ncbi:MAG: carbohydrate-binding family 9-like protein [Bacteroidota bacterium]|nr:carbohydrate-binding family 9-like protein [Bacteroidota bacterium]